MSEETGATEATTAESTATVDTPQSFIDNKGNFTEGWEKAYLTEDQQGNARVAGGRVKSIGGLLDTVINSDKMISGDKILRLANRYLSRLQRAYLKAFGAKTGQRSTLRRLLLSGSILSRLPD